MKNIYILIADNCLASSVTGPMDLFNIANTIWFRQAGLEAEPLFNVELISVDAQPVTTAGGLVLTPKKSIKELANCDVLMLAANNFTHKKALIQYINELRCGFSDIVNFSYSGGTIAGYCSATFVLASTGLLKNKHATTSWFFKDYFVQKFPDVKLVMDKLVVQEGNYWTAGATTSYIDLCLKLIDHLAGHQIATLLSKVMLIDKTRVSQQPFMALPKIVEHGDETIANIQEWMQINLSQNITLDDLSTRSAMSKRNFIRRFKNAVGETPAAYLQSIRVETAKRYLENTDLTLQNILEKVGYDDSSAFRRVFHRMTSLTPKAYREKFA